MKTTILTQKNVCAFLGLLMALTILWSAQAVAKVDTTINEVIPMEIEIEMGLGSVQEEAIQMENIDLSDIKEIPTITIINKYGDIVAEFYGEKSELEKKFKETFKKGQFVTASGKHEFYLI
ncbi:hypothetical protein [Aquiflexum sp.]|uniref:hypothetical protein n=1 Tax=Aquiflexum sp. TaxID=1872584 RepID=UPI0035946F5B